MPVPFRFCAGHRHDRHWPHCALQHSAASLYVWSTPHLTRPFSVPRSCLHLLRPLSYGTPIVFHPSRHHHLPSPSTLDVITPHHFTYSEVRTLKPPYYVPLSYCRHGPPPHPTTSQFPLQHPSLHCVTPIVCTKWLRHSHIPSELCYPTPIHQLNSSVPVGCIQLRPAMDVQGP